MRDTQTNRQTDRRQTPRAIDALRQKLKLATIVFAVLDKHIRTYVRLFSFQFFYARKQNASRVFAIVWASVRLSVCLSVRPSVRHTRELYQNGAS